jgi:hypothetical protein
MANEKQTEHWNSDEASHWLSHQVRYDTMLAPFGDRLPTAAGICDRRRRADRDRGMARHGPPPLSVRRWRTAIGAPRYGTQEIRGAA